MCELFELNQKKGGYIMLKELKDHYYMSEDMREFLSVMRAFKTPWVLPIFGGALLLYVLVSFAILFLS